jgi:hypothetical protein
MRRLYFPVCKRRYKQPGRRRRLDKKARIRLRFGAAPKETSRHKKLAIWCSFRLLLNQPRGRQCLPLCLLNSIKFRDAPSILKIYRQYSGNLYRVNRVRWVWGLIGYGGVDGLTGSLANGLTSKQPQISRNRQYG